MSNDWFFEKFALIADAPGAVPKMRGLILQLAVHGKLVPQDPSDEPAEKLREPDEELSSGSPSEVPLGWILARLEQLAEINGGFAFKSTDYTEEGARVVRISDFDEFGFKDHKVVRHSFSAEFHKFTLEEQNILMAMTGGTVGKSYFVRFMPEVMVVNQRVATIKVLDSAMPRYIDIVIRSEMTQEVIRRAKNSTNDNISMGDIKGFTIPLPPLAEQKRIVAKVDELMGLCDALESQQQERDLRKSVLVRSSLSRFAVAPTPENLGYLFHKSYDIPPSELRKSILTLAVQGKLVPQDPNDEPADELFERIQAERAIQEAKGACKTARPIEPIQESDEPFTLPGEWKWTRLRSLVFKLGDGLHGTPDYSAGSDCYFINGNNLIDGRIIIRPHTKTVSADEASKHRKPLTLSTVLVSINGTLGSVAFYDNENIILGKSVCYFNLVSLIDKHFARCVIESPYFVTYASTNATGTTIRNLGLKAMNFFPFPLPPLAEQRRIVAKVDQLMALVDELERQQEASLENASKLLDAIVQEMTSGGQGIAATLES